MKKIFSPTKASIRISNLLWFGVVIVKFKEYGIALSLSVILSTGVDDNHDNRDNNHDDCVSHDDHDSLFIAQVHRDNNDSIIYCLTKSSDHSAQKAMIMILS